VAINGTITATFSAAMDAATINASTFTVASASAPITGTVEYSDASRTALFAPATLLANNTTYTATLTGGVQDQAGNALATSTWTFTTARAEETPPSVLGTIPADHATPFPPNSSLAVTFSEAMDGATIDGTTFTVADVSGPVSGTVTYDEASRSAIFTPAAPLAGNAAYTATVAAGVQDLAGNGTPQPVAWTFTTGTEPDTTPPAVSASSPESPDGSQVPAGSPITATFSEPVDPRTITGATFTLTGTSGAVNGTLRYDPATRTATFTPTAALALGATYTAAIATGVRDLAGNGIAEPVSWTFTLAVRYSGFVSNINADRDEHIGSNSNAWGGHFEVQGLRLSWDVAQHGDHWQYAYHLYGAPKAGGKWVNSFCIGTPDGFESTDLLAGWSLVEPVNGVLVDGEKRDGVLTDVTSFLTRPVSAEEHTAVSGLRSLFGIRWQMMSEGNFQESIANTMFILIFSTRRAPVWGDLLVESPIPSGGGPPTAWNTHLTDWTDAPVTGGNNGGWVLVPGTPGPDTEPPTLLSTCPADLTAGLGIRDPITASFSEAVDGATLIDPGAFTLQDSSGAQVSGTVSYDPLTYVASFTPSATLFYDTTYSVAVVGVDDLAGHTMAPVTWTFTTETPDTTLPTVLTTSPANGATDAAVDGAITASFSEAIDPSTLGAFTVSAAAGNTVAGSVAYDAATHTVSFAPAADLSHDATYSATVSGVADLTGNLMPFAVSWTFSTAPPPAFVPTGDVNGDGIVDFKDAQRALQIAAGEFAPAGEELIAGDVAPLVNSAPSPDGKVDVGDVLVILRKVAGQEDW
jgi:hypothetical protein